jgi:hypothetical protein
MSGSNPTPIHDGVIQQNGLRSPDAAQRAAPKARLRASSTRYGGVVRC